MKKILFLTLVVLFGMASVGFAAASPNVGNATQKGSVLIFPKVDVTEDTDTLISISNDYFKPVNIKCYWVNMNQEIQDFQFELTANQPIMFSSKCGLSLWDPRPVTVPPFDGPVGELKCWAVDDAGANQINFNHLYGTAKVVNFEMGSAYEYNSWNFAARSGSFGLPVGTGGNIKLNGAEYDACPQYLLFNFNSVGSNFGFFKDTDLTIVPCKQDLRQDRLPTFTKIKFDIWNENETKYTGAHKCIKCWFEDYLSAISGKFKFYQLHTTAGRFRAQGVASTVCKPAAAASPLIGLSAELLDFSFGGENDSEFAFAGTTANSAGLDGTGFILWDPQNSDGVPERAPR